MELSRLVRRPTPEKFGGKEIVLPTETDKAHLNALRRQVAVFHQSGVVIYVFAPTTKGMATIRFESSETGNFSEKVVSETNITEQEFQQNLEAARQDRSAWTREQLRKSLLPTDLSGDTGKLVMYKDMNFYGVLPQSFELQDGLLLASGELKQAVENAKLLKNKRIDPKDISAFVGYPETPEHLKAIFEEDSKEPLEHWQGLMTGMKALRDKFGFELYGLHDMDSLGSKEAVLDKVAHAKNIVWIIAHGSGCTIRLTSGERIRISPMDIESLRLANSPLVIVRVCDAAESGFPRAFLKAGASAVVVNRGKVSASDVNDEMSTLLHNFKDLSFYDAVQKTNASGVKRARSNGVYVDLIHTSVAPFDDSNNGEKVSGNN